jgi:EAL domain-containing protein (putative c-di-GMP-specific phosphodiesterase class I)
VDADIAANGANANLRGVFIGCDHYKSLSSLSFACADAEAMHRSMTDPLTGLMNPASALLLRDPSRDELEKGLVNLFIDEKGSDQSAIVFFYAGHAVKQSDGDVALALPDFEMDELQHHPFARNTLRLSRLRQDYIDVSSARLALIALDCCNADKYARLVAGEHGERRDSELESRMSSSFGDHGPGGRSRVVFAACGQDQRALEDPSIGHGRMTYLLLQGLGGMAADKDGVVTAGGLAAYVSQQSIDSQLHTVRYETSGAAQVPLTKPGPEVIDLRLGSAAGTSNTRVFEDPEHQLSAYEDLISLLTAWRPGTASERGRAKSALVHLMKCVGAEIAGVYEYGLTPNISPSFLTSSEGEGQLEERCRELTNWLEPGVLDRSVVRPHMSGTIRRGGDFPDSAAVVLRRTESTTVVYLGGLETSSPVFADAGQRIAAVFYDQAVYEGRAGNALFGAMLDDVRRHIGYVSRNMVAQRLNVFRKQLRMIAMVFQPVVDIEYILRGEPAQVDGWEALARLTEDGVEAGEDGGHPCDAVFEAAELWGPRFMEELDCHILPLTIEHVGGSDEVVGGSLGHRSLSINVYPQTLVRDQFREVLLATLARYRTVRPSTIVLEISEKTELPRFEGLVATGDRAVARAFGNRLKALHRDSGGVRFAIDDFGVGHANSLRLDEMSFLDHIKIDRDILSSPNASQTLSYVASLARNGNLGCKVIVEGYEDDTLHCSLRDIVDAGVSLVQGYCTGRPRRTASLEVDSDLLSRRLGVPLRSRSA